MLEIIVTPSSLTSKSLWQDQPGDRSRVVVQSLTNGDGWSRHGDDQQLRSQLTWGSLKGDEGSLVTEKLVSVEKLVIDHMTSSATELGQGCQMSQYSENSNGF